MPNLRVLYDNVADSAALQGSSGVGNLTIDNLRTEIKSQVWRVAGTSAAITLTWPTVQALQAVVIPACNLSSMATIRVRIYDAIADGELVVDSGQRYACPGPNLGSWDWSGALNANAFAGGGFARTAVWLPPSTCGQRLEIAIDDPGNSASYLDFARLLAGPYWSPQYNADWSPVQNVVDNSKTTRTDAGDTRTDIGAFYETVALKLSYLVPDDRSKLLQIIRNKGTSKNIFLSLYPEHADPVLEQDNMIYGHRSGNGVTNNFFGNFSADINMESW